MIAPTMNTIDEKATDRFTYLAKMLVAKGASVELITSDFNHRKKEYRSNDSYEYLPFKITFIHEKKYKKNISIKRIIGHNYFARGVAKYLKKRKRPDDIYLAIPSTSCAYKVAKFCKKNNLPYLIDVQDLWPEAFSIILGNNFISKTIISLLKHKPDYAYAKATYVYSVSKTYTQRALIKNKIFKRSGYVFLGNDYIDLSKVVVSDYDYIFKEKYFNIVYVGNFGKSYDFLNLFKALNHLQNNGINDLRLIMIGDGVQFDYLKELSSKLFHHVVFTGFLEYGKLVKLCSMCDLAVNPIVKNSVSSVINKVGDYAQAGIPVVNSQNSNEYRELVDLYKCGVNAKCEDYLDIALKIQELYYDKKARIVMGENNKKLFNDLFDRKNSYIEIVDCLLENK